MKTIFLSILAILLHFQGFSQPYTIELDGMGELKLGAHLSEVEAILEAQETVPSYAWHAPLTFEKTMLILGLSAPLSAADSLDIIQFIELDFILEDEGIYSPKDTHHSYFGGLRITSIKLSWNSEQRITSIGLTIDPADVSEITKGQLMNLLEDKFGHGLCDFSLVSDEPPYPFYCSWYTDDQANELVVSDMYEPGGDFGMSLNIVFQSY